tara:strand:- start:1103 stop:1801 length:699 start_codon:yes stop_codon:yes gene_type:complete
MGIPSVTRFLSKINNSISSGNLYDIEFSFPPQPAFKGGKPSLGDWLARATTPPDSGRKTSRLDGELISMLANEVQIPGVNMTSQDVRSVKKGINMKPAMAKVYNEMDLSFILDVNSTPMRFFTAWQDYIAGNFEGASFTGDPYGPVFAKKEKQAFATSFYNDYTCDVKIRKYEKFDGTNYDNFHIQLVKAYPYMVSSIPYSAASSQVVKLSVGMYYEYSTRLTPPKQRKKSD